MMENHTRTSAFALQHECAGHLNIIYAQIPLEMAPQTSFKPRHTQTNA